MRAYFLGRVPYREAWALQERLRLHVLGGGEEVVLLCEHPPVLTLGKSTGPSDILADGATLSAGGIERVETSRGGRVTYHGPGQLVVYPIVRVRGGAVKHVEWLAGSAIDVAAGLGVAARFCRDRIGVWVGERKLAAIGIHISRRVSIHGLSLNVTREATAISQRGWFVPCGEVGARPISLEEAAAQADVRLQSPLSVEALARPFAEALFRRAGEPSPPAELPRPAAATLLAELATPPAVP